MMVSVRTMAAWVVAMSLTAASARAGEKDDAALAKAPAAVREAVAKGLAVRKMAEFGRERVGQTVIYEVGIKVDGVDHALNISETGELLFEEVDVEVEKVPAAVTAAVKAAQPTGKIVEAATAKIGDRQFYLIDVKVGDEARALRVTEGGKVLADEVVTKLPAVAEK